jgi:hypothetical protein
LVCGEALAVDLHHYEVLGRDMDFRLGGGVEEIENRNEKLIDELTGTDNRTLDRRYGDVDEGLLVSAAIRRLNRTITVVRVPITGRSG